MRITGLGRTLQDEARRSNIATGNQGICPLDRRRYFLRIKVADRIRSDAALVVTGRLRRAALQRALLLLLEPTNMAAQLTAERLLSLPINSSRAQTVGAYRHWWRHYN